MLRSLAIATLLITTLSLSTSGLAIAQTQTRTGTVTVGATVLGSKPIVDVYHDVVAGSDATAGDYIIANDATTAITAIVGSNLTGALVVTLDDANATPLTGTISVASSCDADASTAVCGTGSYDKLTGLSIPASVTPGTYHILVTTAAGTNITSLPLTVKAAPAGTAASIQAVDPNPLIVMNGTTQTVSITLADTDSTSIAYAIATTSGDSTWSPSSGTATLTLGTPANAGTVYTDITAGAAGIQTADITADDDGNTANGVDDTEILTMYVQPAW